MTVPAAALRIGDAERLAAAERLASHFSHGRLDQAELDDRLGQAMRARTAADLTALFADLPQAEEVPATVDNGGRELAPAGPPPRPPRALRRRGRTLRGLVLAVLLVLGVAVAANGVTHSVIAWALLLILAAAWLLRRGVRE